MKIAIFTVEQNGQNTPTFRDLQNNLGFKLGLNRVDNGSFGFTSLDENDELTTGKFPTNAKCFLQSRQDNRKLVPDDGGARPDYINFFSVDLDNNFSDSFLMDGFIIFPDTTEYTNDQLATILHAKRLLVGKGLNNLADLL